MKRYAISHPEIKKHIKWAKANGYCIQCQHPWYDGFCTDNVKCKKTEEIQKEMTRIETLAISLLEQGWII